MDRIKRYILLLLGVCFLFGVFSCRSTKKLTDVSSVSDTTFASIDKYKDKYDFITDNAFTFDWLAAKFTIKMGDLSANGQIRMRKDSVIWVSLTKFIEVARVKLTPDSLFFHNKIQNEYYAGNYDFLKKNFGVEMDFSLLESLLTGNDFPLYAKTHHEIFCEASGSTRCTFVCKDRVLFKGNTTVKAEKQSLIIDVSDGRIRLNTFRLPQGIECSATYAKHTQTKRGIFPTNQTFELKDFTSNKGYGIDLRFDSPVLDVPQSFPFSIPNSATAISF